MARKGAFTGIAIACLFAAATMASAQAPAFLQPPTLASPWETKIAELEKRIKELEAAKPAAVQPVPIAPPIPLSTDPTAVTLNIYPGKEGKLGLLASFTLQEPDTTSSPEPPRAFSGELSNLLSPPFSGTDNAFTFRSPDGQHVLRITGQVQADYHDYPRHGDFTDIDSFLLRRARLGIEGELFQYYEFRLLPDFGQAKVVMQDCFLNVHYWDEIQFMVGKFKEPLSYEQLVQDRFVPTVERSLIDQVMPARDVGVMIHGQKLFNGQVDYAVGVFNGEINGDLDTNDIHDFAGRIAWKPFNYSSLPDYVRNLQIGISGSAGVEQEPLSLTGVNNETLKTPGGVPWLTFAKNAYANGIRTRSVPELSYFYDQLGFMAEYLRMDQQIQSGSAQTVTVKNGKTTTTRVINDAPEDIRFGGFMFTATYLLTGEKRTMYSELVKPLRPFDAAHPFSNPGAWELVARVSHLQVDPSIFQSGAAYQLANPVGNSDAATELTVGFNWYLNSLVRMQFNWEHAWFQQPLLLGPPSMFFRQTDAMLVRFQVIF